MTKTEIWFSKKLEMLFYTGFASCFSCNKIIEFQAVIIRRISTEKQHFFCMDCSKKISQDVFLTRFVHMTDTPPSDSIPIFRDNIEVSSVSSSKGDIVSVWDDEVVKQSNDKEEIVDNAFQSHNKDFMIQSNAKNPLMIENEIVEKDKIMLVDESTLDNISDSYYNGVTLLASRDELEENSDDDYNIPISSRKKSLKMIGVKKL
jgi:hypothetical protein